MEYKTIPEIMENLGLSEKTVYRLLAYLVSVNCTEIYPCEEGDRFDPFPPHGYKIEADPELVESIRKLLPMRTYDMADKLGKSPYDVFIAVAKIKTE
ncbi:MAG: hypothetical protein WCO84_04375 [bacterium]